MAILDAVFADKPGQTPQDVERRRRMAAALIESGAGGPPPSSGLELAGRLAMTLSGQYQGAKAERQDASNRSAANQALIQAVYGTNPPASTGMQQPRAASPFAPSMPAAPTETAEGQRINNRVAMAHQGSSALPASFLSAVDSTEGAGAYDTLYGHAQRDKFAGTDISRMPIRDVLAFSDPNGAYAQHVKGQIGRVATPMGRHQIVGTTLKNAVAEMGLDPNQPFDAQTQDAVAAHLARRRLASAGSMPEKISALRSEWHGFNSVPDDQMVQIINDLENGGSSMGAVNAMAAPSSGAPSERGSQGEIRQGSDGQNYQFVETRGMMGADGTPAGEQGWIRTNQAPMQVAQAGPDNRALIAELLGNPYTAEMGQQLLMQELGRRQEMSDPMRQIEMERAQLELEQLRNPQPQTTDDIREYEYARSQGYEGTYADFQQDMRKAGASSVNVSTGSEVGTIPQGFELFTDPETGARSMRPIAGGPAAMEAEQAAAANANRDQKQSRTAGVVTQDIDRALTIIDGSGLPTTGAIGEMLSSIGGTGARDLRGLLDTVKANSGFAELQAMRDSSPTGGALGQVTERELAFLQATIGNLEQSQTAGQLKDNLNRVYNTYLDIVHGEGNGPERRRLSFETPAGEVQRPGDVPQELWDAMTPEERALWK